MGAKTRLFVAREGEIPAGATRITPDGSLWKIHAGDQARTALAARWPCSIAVGTTVKRDATFLGPIPEELQTMTDLEDREPSYFGSCGTVPILPAEDDEAAVALLVECLRIGKPTVHRQSSGPAKPASVPVPAAKRSKPAAPAPATPTPAPRGPDAAALQEARRRLSSAETALQEIQTKLKTVKNLVLRRRLGLSADAEKEAAARVAEAREALDRLCM
jgi:hypothetical protein